MRLLLERRRDVQLHLVADEWHAKAQAELAAADGAGAVSTQVLDYVPAKP